MAGCEAGRSCGELGCGLDALQFSCMLVQSIERLGQLSNPIHLLYRSDLQCGVACTVLRLCELGPQAIKRVLQVDIRPLSTLGGEPFVLGEVLVAERAHGTVDRGARRCYAEANG